MRATSKIPIRPRCFRRSGSAACSVRGEGASKLGHAEALHDWWVLKRAGEKGVAGGVGRLYGATAGAGTKSCLRIGKNTRKPGA